MEIYVNIKYHRITNERVRSKMKNIILCSGVGSRLWPISRPLLPKQFIKLFNDKTLFQITVERNSKLCNGGVIVSNQKHFSLVNDEICKIKNIKYDLLVEPISKDTASAIALACLNLDSEDIVLVTPSDHFIENQIQYQEAIKLAEEQAIQNKIVTLGIKPNSAKTNFGYIKIQPNSKLKLPYISKVFSLHEKPDIHIAKQYLENGNYYWHAGIFCFKVNVFLSELQKYSPNIYQSCLLAHKNSDKNNSVVTFKVIDMQNIPYNSVDYALLEKSTLINTVICDLGWLDIGSFDTLYKIYNKDHNNNTQNSNLIALNSHNNLVYGDKRLITMIDIDDCVIVDTDDALLISKKDSSQKVKHLVDKIQRQKDHIGSSTCFKNYTCGSFNILENNSKYKIRQIEIPPKQEIFLERDFNSNEHWTVINGVLTLKINNIKCVIKPNESIHMEAGKAHSLANENDIPLIIIGIEVK